MYLDKLIFSLNLLIVCVFGSILQARAGCNKDNCLRAFFGKGNEAVQFCSSFTTNAAQIPSPTYASMCTGNQASRMTSACSCLTSTTSSSSTTVTSSTASQPNCNRDNCLRAFVGKGNEALSFCYSLTKGIAQTPYPGFVTQCTGNQASRMTSACSCLGSPSPTVSSSRSSSVSSQTPTPTCQPSVILEGASESAFNKKSTAFSVKLTCSKLDTNNFTAFANFEPVTNMVATADGIEFQGFTVDYVMLLIYALDVTGKPIVGSFQLLFGATNMPVLVIGSDGNPAKDVTVQANSTIYPGVSQLCTTAADGRCLFTSLISTTISLAARTTDNAIAVNGLAATTGLVTMKLMPYIVPGPGDSFDIANGTTGWDGGFNTDTSFKTKRDTSLVVSTNGQTSLQSASKSFPVHPFTKVAYVKYKFITAEVPGGYFGSRFNDYYSISIRSDTGAFVSVTNSMNALGIGAFDAAGATDWFTLTLTVPSNTKSVRYDIGVSNVADGLYDSRIVVQQAGDLQCDNCGDCSTCPSDPMCQDRCKTPPTKSCDFYRNCAQKQLGCTLAEYPLGYGERNCNKFVNNIDHFTSQGQAWIYNTMHCLQVAMVPVLKPCTATCSSFGAAAFASHAKCYVDSGVCSLGCYDIMWLVSTVMSDLNTWESFKQIGQTVIGCLENLIQTLQGCAGDAIVVLSPADIALKVTVLLLKTFVSEAN